MSIAALQPLAVPNPGPSPPPALLIAPDSIPSLVGSFAFEKAQLVSEVHPAALKVLTLARFHHQGVVLGATLTAQKIDRSRLVLINALAAAPDVTAATKQKLKAIADAHNEAVKKNGEVQANNISDLVKKSGNSGHLTPEVAAQLDAARKAAKDDASKAIDDLYDNIGSAISNLPSHEQLAAAHTAVGLGDILTSAFKAVAQTIVDLVNTVVEKIVEAWNAVKAWVSDAVHDIGNFFTNCATQIAHFFGA